MKDILKYKAPVNFEAAYLKRVAFDLHSRPMERKSKKTYELNVSLSCEKNFSDQGRRLLLTLEIDIPQLENDFPCSISVTYEGIFSIPAEARAEVLKRFSEISAPAILFPYVRAELSRISALSGLPPINLPPINVQRMLSEDQKKPPAASSGKTQEVGGGRP